MTSETVEYPLARAADPAGYERWYRQARSTGWCARPIRLAGSTVALDADTGEIRHRFDTVTEPDGTLLKACGQRRATACGSCAATYRADAYQLVAAGLRGGKGVAADIACHPAVFVTLTAPSFGPVHSRRERAGIAQPCRPGHPRLCEHGCPSCCFVRHGPGDEALGTPICTDCFDYPAVILWNASATELWRRTTIATARQLSRRLGLSTRDLAGRLRLAHLKVVEYQARGTVHLHAVVRTDALDADLQTRLGPLLLAEAIHAGARAAWAPWPRRDTERTVRWGEQIDIRPLQSSARGVVAGYISKYATKSTDPFGRLDHRLYASELASLDVGDHLARLVRTAWNLGGDPDLADLRLRDWAHTLGFRGHWLTKSRHYSTTFGALRAARAAQAACANDETQGDLVIKQWRYVARGWANPGDADLAATAARHHAEARSNARESRRPPAPVEDHREQAPAHP